MRLHLDTETYSDVPISAGVYAYAEHAQIMLCTYAWGDEPVQVLDYSDGDILSPMRDLVSRASEIVIHNSQFDRVVCAKHAIVIPAEKIFDTMICALAHSLPGALAQLGEVFHLDNALAKGTSGKKLIQLFCKPAPKSHKLRRATRDTHPQQWEQFREYAKSDILAMRALRSKLPTKNYMGAEHALWELDQRINDRGFKIDADLARGAISALHAEKIRLRSRTEELTHGAVSSTTQRDVLLGHLLYAHGVGLPDLKSATIERRLRDENLPDGVRELLGIRLMASMASGAKYQKLLDSMSPDERLRGTLQFCGARRTGRWAGRLIQPQNFLRPTLEDWQIADAIRLLKLPDDALPLVFPNVMEAVANVVRGCIVAAPGHKLVASDLSNIEGRGISYLAQEEWKVAAFADFDRGIGLDLYIATYAKTFNVDPEDVTGKLRQIGKVMELAFGYGGGVGAWITFALAYNIDIEALAVQVWSTLPAWAKEEAEHFRYWYVLEQGNPDFGLSERAFVACDTIKRMWRAENPQIVNLWSAIEDRVRAAISVPGKKFHYNGLTTWRSGAWLRIKLPSGRALCYPSPRIGDNKEISYLGVNTYTHKWGRIKTYGGKLAENITQAFARDALAANMQPAEDAGYPIVLSVHDELITEPVNAPQFTAQGLSDIMCRVPSWAQGLPLAAKGFEAQRYHKE